MAKFTILFHFSSANFTVLFFFKVSYACIDLFFIGTVHVFHGKMHCIISSSICMHIKFFIQHSPACFSSHYWRLQHNAFVPVIHLLPSPLILVAIVKYGLLHFPLHMGAVPLQKHPEPTTSKKCNIITLRYFHDVQYQAILLMRSSLRLELDVSRAFAFDFFRNA